MKKKNRGLFLLPSLVIVTALLLAGCPDPNKNGDSPAVADPTKQGIAFSGKKLEITFDKELKSFDASQITVTRNDSVIAATAYTLSVSGKKLVMTFKANLSKGQKYKVSLKAGAVTGKDGGTTKKEDSAETTFGAPPAFQSMAFVGTKLELTFNQTLNAASASASHPDPSKVTITRADTTLKNTDYSLGIDVARLVITFKTSPTANQKYTVALEQGAVKSNKISSLAVSPAKEITFGVTPPPAYTGIVRNNNKIELRFSKNLATTANVSPNPANIAVTRAGTTDPLTKDTDYSLSIDGKKLVITLIKSPIEGNYTVALSAEAVKSADGKFSAVVKSDPTITMYNLPDIMGAPVFKTGSATELIVTFNTALASIDTGSFTVQSKAATAGAKYANVSATPKLRQADKTKIDITLKTAATDARVYRVVVAAGGVTAIAGGVSNVVKRESSGVEYSAKPALVDTPHIVGKKLVATFNMNIDLLDANKVEVWKGAKPGNKVDGTSASVNTTTKTLLEVSLPSGDTSAADDVYRLKLLADAVSKDGDDKNKNAPATSSDITISAAPVLDGTQDPYMVGRKIYVTFNKAIEYVDTAKVKVKTGDSLESLGAETKPTTNSVVNPNNDKQLVITVDDDPPKDNHYYRVHLEAEAIGGKNTALTAEITPTDKDIQVAPSPVLTANTKPVFSSKTELSVSFKAAVAFVDIKTIKVQNSADGSTFTDVAVANRSIAIDGTDPKKVNITLTNEATPYIPWKVIFPVGSVRDAKRNGNKAEQATDKATFRLSDIHSWNKVLANGTPVSGDRWIARSHHTSVMFNNKIWVMGGVDGTSYLNDVWSSADGSTWENESAKITGTVAEKKNKLWPARGEHTSVVFNNKIWVLGGRDKTSYLNDRWSSTDGITWAKSATPTTPATELWSGRILHASVVFDAKIWVMGGHNSISPYYYNDVWSSADGETWTKVKAVNNVGWSARYGHRAVVVDDKIWVMGGLGIHDIDKNLWYSTNGKAWTEAQKFFPVSTSIYTTSVLFKSRIWALGGSVQSSVGGRINKVFSLTEDADEDTAWLTEKDADWTARYGHSSVVFKNKIWVMGGATGARTYVNDVWNFGSGN